jgi:hypothetical protein
MLSYLLGLNIRESVMFSTELKFDAGQLIKKAVKIKFKKH